MSRIRRSSCAFLLLTGSIGGPLAHAQQPADAPAEIVIRRYVAAPTTGAALFEHRADTRPVRHWPAGRRLYVQTAPDTAWFRVLVLGNSYFVRQRTLPVPGWRH